MWRLKRPEIGESGACHGGPYVPRGLLLQWHITERCNLRCAHCYQEAYDTPELPFADLLGILEQYKALLAKWRREGMGRPVRGHITITGGEPFVRSDFLDLLEVFAAHRKAFSFAILTNGSLIDAAMAQRLRQLGPSFVQVSVEGTQATHDGIRGAGSFERTVSAIRHLVRARVRTLISFTANRLNYREFPAVARLGRTLRVTRVWADRLIPNGSGSDMAGEMLTPDETRAFFEIMQHARDEAARSWFGRTQIAMHRALQFLVSGGGGVYHCTAGDSLITVQPNGDLLPCRRMPIPVGNLMDTPLADLYYDADLFRALRDKERVSDGCEDCFHAGDCRGGLKCLSYALTGNPFQADPGCWRATPDRPTATGGLRVPLPVLSRHAGPTPVC